MLSISNNSHSVFPQQKEAQSKNQSPTPKAKSEVSVKQGGLEVNTNPSKDIKSSVETLGNGPGQTVKTSPEGNFGGKSQAATHTTTQVTTGDVKEKKDGDGVLDNAIIVGFISGILVAIFAGAAISRFILRLWRIVCKSGHLMDEWTKAELELSPLNFVPNSFIRYNRHMELVPLPELKKGKDEIDLFLDEVIFEKHCPMYLLLAPTGVGKTTFLHNAFLRYQKRSVGKNWPQVYLGKVNNKTTLAYIDKVIADNKAAESILLLDGLDEFRLKDGISADLFWEHFEQFWQTELIEKRLSYFKKVVITVREQFFNSADREVIRYDHHDSRRILLQPFSSEKKRKEYINKKFPGSSLSERNLRDNINWLIGKIHDRGFEIIEKPLILSFTELLWADYDKNQGQREKKVFFTSEYIYRAITEQWIIRESKKVTDGFSEREIGLMYEYCQLLAFSIASSNNSLGLDVQELTKMERSLNLIADLRGVQGRSLLIRVREKQGNGDHMKENFRFIHGSFMEYFLAVYLFNHPEAESTIQFERYTFAMQTLVGMRWRARKELFTMDVFPEPDEYNFICNIKSGMFEIMGFFTDLVDNEWVSSKLLDVETLRYILDQEAPDWRTALETRHEISLEIGDECFYDSELNKPYKEAEAFIKLFSSSIHRLNLFEVDIKDEDLSCFSSCEHLRSIYFYNLPNISGESFKYFTKTIHSLYAFSLQYIEIEESYLSVFSGSDSLSILKLSGLLIEGDCLSFFAKNNELVSLDLSRNLITDDKLLLLGSKPEIEDLDLSENKLLGPSLSIFKDSRNTLIEFDLSRNEIADVYLEQFDGVENLELLNLDNCKINGSSLKYFSKSTPKLKNIILGDNFIDDEHLAVFKGCCNLHNIRLSACQLTGPALSYFIDCAPLLVSLHLDDNKIEDRYFEVFKNTTKIEVLELSGTGITAKGLSNFSSTSKALKVLCLTGNVLDVDAFSFFSESTSIKELRLSGNLLSGDFMRYFNGCSNTLEILELRACGISDQYLSCLRRFTVLKELVLAENNISSLGLENLQHFTSSIQNLDLSNNQIRDKNLNYLSAFRYLSVLNLSQNHITGSFLESIKDYMFSLTEIYLDNNTITDEYLKYLGYIKDLSTISLSGNQLQGNTLGYLNLDDKITEFNIRGNPLLPSNYHYFDSLNTEIDSDIKELYHEHFDEAHEGRSLGESKIKTDAIGIVQPTEGLEDKLNQNSSEPDKSDVSKKISSTTQPGFNYKYIHKN